MDQASEKINQLKKKVFTFNTSDGDHTAIRIAIQNWLIHKSRVSFTQMLWEIVWLRNDKGQTSKYLFFNERTQKLWLDKYFLEWAKLTLNKMEATLHKIDSSHLE